MWCWKRSGFWSQLNLSWPVVQSLVTCKCALFVEGKWRNALVQMHSPSASYSLHICICKPWPGEANASSQFGYISRLICSTLWTPHACELSQIKYYTLCTCQKSLICSYLFTCLHYAHLCSPGLQLSNLGMFVTSRLIAGFATSLFFLNVMHTPTTRWSCSHDILERYFR